MRSTSRQTALIAACAFVLAFVGVLFAQWRHAARTAPATEHATEPLPDVQGATKGPSVSSDTAPQFESSAIATESTAVKPVVIGTVKPWTEIARMPPYVKANPDERMAIRDLYWRTCVEEKIPLEQRTPAYWHFVRSWEGIESGSPGAPARTTYEQLQREKQPRVPSPVDAETMRHWCRTQAPGS